MKGFNPIAKHAWKANKAVVFKAKKGRGSFKRDKKVRDET